MGFCRRCGEIVVGPRCKCGGTPVAPVVSWDQLNLKEQTQDKWSKTYVSRDKSPHRPFVRESSVETTAPSRSTITGNEPPKRFPRPLSTTVTANPAPMSSRVSAHITSTMSHTGLPPSPLKHSTTHFSDPMPEADILPSLDTASLSKVYGSVLQPKESLETHSCAICASPFLPDATIYPDPNAPHSTRFLCRPCFTSNGGSQGMCSECSRPVLTLKSEGGFVSASGKVWHKRCFRCDGCFKNIGDTPMVDLLGKPSCVECFDSCLKRDGSTPQKRRDSECGGENGNLGGVQGGKSREGSPALEELEQRLGISKRRESESSSLPGLRSESNAVHGLSTRRSAADHSPTPVRQYEGLESPKGSPSPSRRRSGTNPFGDARGESASPKLIKEVRKRLPESSLVSSPTALSPSRIRSSLVPTSFSPTATTPTVSKQLIAKPISQRASFSSRSSSSGVSSRGDSEEKHRKGFDKDSTPDLSSDFSDTATQSSGPDSPPIKDVYEDVFGDGDMTIRGRGVLRNVGYRKGDFLDEDGAAVADNPISALKTSTKMTTPTSKPRVCLTTPAAVSPCATCANCHKTIFAVQANGTSTQFVTVPQDPGNNGSGLKTYHIECFRCVVCGNIFSDDGKGKAIFVRSEEGTCHVECALPTKKVGKIPTSNVMSPGTSMTPTMPSQDPRDSLSSRHNGSPPTTSSTNTPMSPPRFGSTTACPGCHTSVSPMERGVVPGPQGTRWHVGCLVCGGKKQGGRNVERKKGVPGCGKKLDSAAKGDGEGRLWCRECLLLLTVERRDSVYGHGSRMRCSKIVPSYTGNSGVFTKVNPQFTGTTTLARQFTGLGGGDALLIRQMTGGGGQLNPTRQLGLDRSQSPTKGTLYRSGSPIKQLGSIRERPRPKSVIGMRGTKSVDEGRGMFLVRQMTGGCSC